MIYQLFRQHLTYRRFQIVLPVLFLVCFMAHTQNINKRITEIVGTNETNVASTQEDQSDFPDFNSYIKIFNKAYHADTEEYQKRKNCYEKRVNQLKKLQNEAEYKIGVSQFTDETEQERKSRNGLLILEHQETKEDEQSKIKLSQSNGGFPVNLDWREKNIITSIKNQGTCGSCWTFATAAYGESLLVKTGKQKIDIDLSEQYLLSCTPQCSCKGGYLQNVFQKASSGIPSELAYPYNPSSFNSPLICFAYQKYNFGSKVFQYYRLNDNQLIKLLQDGPVAISVSAVGWQEYKNGVFRCNIFDSINHAVLLVGYTPSYWIIKNQWGQKWGEKGFIRVSRDQNSNCKIGASAFIMFENYIGLITCMIGFLALLLL